jgi:hypothetical protein
MGIESRHPEYDNIQPKWQRCRDTFEGEDAVKKRGEQYLPKLSKQDDDSYQAYKTRATFFNAVNLTISGLVGAVLRLDAKIEAPAKLESLFNDITNTGVSLSDFIEGMLTEQLLMGRQGVLIDHDGTRPYLTGYTTEQVTNWLEDAIILQESYRAVDPKDHYKSEFKTQYRELVMEEGRFIVRIWRKGKKDWEVVADITPVNKGVELSNIPFIAVSQDGANLTPMTPPLLALADMSLSHYRTSADLEHGRHFTALPTPYVTGVDTDSELVIGSGTAWILPDTQSKAGYLEFTGQGLRALEVAMEEKRSMMAALGAQLLEGQKKGIEAAEAVRLRQNAESSTLASTVKSVEQAVQQMLTQMAEWMGVTDDITVELNTDFVDVKLTPQEVTALMQTWQSGGVSHETFLWNLQRGEMLPPNISIEDERSRVEVQTVGGFDED